MWTSALSITLSLSLAGVPVARPIASKIRAVSQQAAASAPLTPAEWQRQRQRDDAEKSKDRGKLWGLVGGTLALGTGSVSIVCAKDANGDCDKQSRRIASGFTIAAGIGAVVGVAGLVRYVRARCQLRDLDAHQPR